jgi:hypothetical protein
MLSSVTDAIRTLNHHFFVKPSNKLISGYGGQPGPALLCPDSPVQLNYSTIAMD